METLDQGVKYVQSLRHSGIFILNFKRYFTPCSSVSIINFEQVNAGWQKGESQNGGKKKTKHPEFSHNLLTSFKTSSKVECFNVIVACSCLFWCLYC